MSHSKPEQILQKLSSILKKHSHEAFQRGANIQVIRDLCTVTCSDLHFQPLVTEIVLSGLEKPLTEPFPLTAVRLQKGHLIRHSWASVSDRDSQWVAFASMGRTVFGWDLKCLIRLLYGKRQLFLGPVEAENGGSIGSPKSYSLLKKKM